MSRYALVERLGTPVMNLFVNANPGTAANSVPPSLQFQNLYTPLANISTFDVNQYLLRNLILVQCFIANGTAGILKQVYTIWARTCEKIRPICQQCAIPFDGNVNFALKGDARTYGFVAQDAMVPRRYNSWATDSALSNRKYGRYSFRNQYTHWYSV